MAKDDTSSKAGSNDAHPPHPATVGRAPVAQPFMGQPARPPHPATLGRAPVAQPFMGPPPRPPHPATLDRAPVAQPFMGQPARPPHPATLGRAPVAQPFFGAPLPYPTAIQRAAPVYDLTTKFQSVKAEKFGQFYFKIQFKVVDNAGKEMKDGFVIQRVDRALAVKLKVKKDGTNVRVQTNKQITTLQGPGNSDLTSLTYWEAFDVSAHAKDQFAFTQVDPPAPDTSEGWYSVTGTATYYPVASAALVGKTLAGTYAPAGGLFTTLVDPGVALGAPASAAAVHSAKVKWDGSKSTLDYNYGKGAKQTKSF